MTDLSPYLRESHVFARYLTGREAGEYVSTKYAEAFSSPRRSQLEARGRFDRLLLALALRHTLLTRMADIYSRMFCPASVVRRRLVMLLAVLESHADTIGRLDSPSCGGLAGFILGMTVRGTVSALLLLPALPVLLPLQLLAGCGGSRRQLAKG